MDIWCLEWISADTSYNRLYDNEADALSMAASDIMLDVQNYDFSDPDSKKLAEQLNLELANQDYPAMISAYNSFQYSNVDVDYRQSFTVVKLDFQSFTKVPQAITIPMDDEGENDSDEENITEPILPVTPLDPICPCGILREICDYHKPEPYESN